MHKYTQNLIDILNPKQYFELLYFQLIIAEIILSEDAVAIVQMTFQMHSNKVMTMFLSTHRLSMPTRRVLNLNQVDFLVIKNTL